MALPQDISGQRFGRLIAVNYSHRIKRRRYWRCKCDCGQFTVASVSQLRSKKIQSCGCYRRENTGAMFRTHGLTKLREFKIWIKMRERCLKPKTKEYPNYGGRGIQICPQWRNSFENFFKDMGRCPPGLEIDRINNDGNYEPENCRWTNRIEQANNKRTTIRVTIDGVTRTLKQWSKESGIPYKLLHQRLHREKSPFQNLLTPVRKPGRPRHVFTSH